MSSKPLSIWTEMPWNIKQDIIDSTDFRTRCVLRKCSKALRCQVNNSDAELLPIKFILADNMVKLETFNDDEIEIEVDYRSEVDGCSVNGKFIRGENYMDRSVADFAAVVRHPRTLVQYVEASDSDRMEREERRMRADDKIAFIRAFEREFSSFPLITESFHLSLKLSQQDQMRMLALTCAGVLKCIGLQPINKYQDTSEIIASEHWESAEEVILGKFRSLPAQSLTRFPCWSALGIKITLDDAKVFVEKIFEFGDSFDKWTIWFGELEPEALNYFLSEFSHRIEGVKHYFFKKMPGTMYHLRFRTKVVRSKTSMSFSKVLSSEVGV